MKAHATHVQVCLQATRWNHRASSSVRRQCNCNRLDYNSISYSLIYDEILGRSPVPYVSASNDDHCSMFRFILS